ncbi:hypothetical protein [Spiroplasma mirum]|nr:MULTISPECIES: hypothetical protein [Spiroplasma]
MAKRPKLVTALSAAKIIILALAISSEQLKRIRNRYDLGFQF